MQPFSSSLSEVYTEWSSVNLMLLQVTSPGCSSHCWSCSIRAVATTFGLYDDETQKKVQYWAGRQGTGEEAQAKGRGLAP